MLKSVPGVVERNPDSLSIPVEIYSNGQIWLKGLFRSYDRTFP